MDRFVQSFAAVADGDLMLCEGHGVAYQADMSRSVPYDAAYFDKYVGYEGAEIARKINAGRVALVNLYASSSKQVLDVGVGSGEFIKSRPGTFGFDVNPKAIAWLKDAGLWSERFDLFRAFTFWDVIEHVVEPDDYFKRMPKGGVYLFTSLPIFADLRRIRESKHYRPNEHYYYWTADGFIAWMKRYGFTLIAQQSFETDAGREDIGSFGFYRP